MRSTIRRVALLATVLMLGRAVDGAPLNLFPHPTFDEFDSNLPESWTSKIWNEPVMKERFGRLEPGRDGTGHCLEIRPANPISVMTISSQKFAVPAGKDYLFKGYYASTCERVTVTGNWIDDQQKPLSSFKFVLPETQDGWIEFFSEVRAPDSTQDVFLQIAIEKKMARGPCAL